MSTTMVPVYVAGLALDPATKMPIVLLKQDGDERLLPIWIGLVEASAIATELEKIPLARPMTHDLMRNVFELMAVTLEKVEIVDLRENTFYALLHLKHESDVWAVDARPSDAIALALRMRAQIFVSEDVLARARRVEAAPAKEGDEEAEPAGAEGEVPPQVPVWTGDQAPAEEILDKLAPDQFGKYKM